MKKRLLSILLSLAVLLSVAVLPGSAADPLRLTVSQETAMPGEQVLVTVSVANNPGLASLKFSVAYGSDLTLTGVTFSNAFGVMVTAPEPYRNPEPLTMISPLQDITANGVFATLTFTVAANAELGSKSDVTLSWEAKDVYNTGYTRIPMTAVNGSVTVGCTHANAENHPGEPAGYTTGGYTAGSWCEDCDTWVSGHAPIAPTGPAVTAAIDAEWNANTGTLALSNVPTDIMVLLGVYQGSQYLWGDMHGGESSFSFHVPAGTEFSGLTLFFLNENWVPISLQRQVL